MNRSISLMATAFVLVVAGGTAAQAACNQSHVNNKTWKISAHEVTQNGLFFCTFRTSGAGSVALTPDACENSQIGTSTDFNSPVKMDIKDGTITMVPGEKCTYDAVLNLDDGTKVLTARVIMESGKTVAIGNFLLTGNAGGTIAMMRQ